MGVMTQLFSAYLKSTKSKPPLLAPCSDIRKFGREVDLLKACNTAAQGPYATPVKASLLH